MRFIASLIALALPAFAQLSAERKQLNVASFEKVWTTIRDKHWEKNPGGLDWKAVHDELRPKIDKAETMDEARAIMRDMLGRLKQTHFGILPADVYKDVDDAARGEGSTGIDVRVLDGQVVVTTIDPGSPAEKAGVKTGWAIASVNDRPLNLTRRELTVLEILAARPDRIVPKEELVEQLFNFDQEASPNAVEQFVARLRRKLADASVEIRTLRGLGYQLAVV